MPFVVPVLAAALTSSLTAIGVGAATAAAIGGTLASIVVGIAVSAGLALIASLLIPKPSIAQQKEVIRQSVASRWRYYGKVKTGGVWSFLAAYHGTLFQIVLLASEEIDAIEQHYLDQYPCTIDPGTGNVTYPYFYTENNGSTKLAYMWWQLGTDSDTAFSRLAGRYPGYTSAMCAKGIAKTLIQLDAEPSSHTPQAYNAGIPRYNAAYRAAKVWDPRDGSQNPNDKSTWKWTWNGVLILMDYLWHQDGMRLPFSMIEQGLTVWIQQANIADEIVALANGGSEARYRLGGGYQLNELPKSILPRMLDPMDARLGIRPDGAIVVDVGYWQNPQDIITDDQIVGYQGFARGRQSRDIRNEFRATFVSPDYLYVEQEADPWINEASVNIDGLKTATLDLTWSPSHRQARVKMKIESYRQDPNGWVGTIVTNAYGLKFLEPNADGTRKRTMFFEIAELGIAVAFEVQRFAFDVKAGRCTFTVIQLDPAAYDWNPATDEGIGPVLPTNASDSIEDPQTFTFEIVNGQISNGVYSAQIQATVNAPTQAGNTVRMQWAVHDDAVSDDDKTWYLFSPEGALTQTSGVLSQGNYDIRVFYWRSGYVSDYLYIRGVIINLGPGSGGGATPTLDFRQGNYANYAPPAVVS